MIQKSNDQANIVLYTTEQPPPGILQDPWQLARPRLWARKTVALVRRLMTDGVISLVFGRSL